MSTDLNAIDAQIAELTEMRKALIEEGAAEAAKALKAFKMEYNYTVEWPHPAQFRVERKVTPDCQARIDRFNEQYPLGGKLEPFIGGMTYSVLVDADGQHYMVGHGGSVIIRTCNCSPFDPEPLPDDILAELRIGIVRESIRRA